MLLWKTHTDSMKIRWLVTRLLPGVAGGSLFPFSAFAQVFGPPFFGPPVRRGPGADLGAGVVQGYAPPARDLPGTILGIINFVLVLVGVLALAYLVYGGFRYITSRGEESEVEAAKGMITNAVIGIVVIGIAAALVNFVIGAILFGAR
ncbi:MAG: membrane protein of unknown function [Parcubacteria group bacterium Gr01-1014_38]|nr:MAG: membrane protein of unknown function [Parcubacteria group bacterium Gr01-1014_38]